MRLSETLQRVLASDELPDEIDISDIEDRINRLWHRTILHSVEHGCCIVMEEHLTVSLIHEAVGWNDGISPLCDVDEDHENYKGFIHTHTLDADGNEDVGFSYRDFRATLADGDHVAIVICGDSVYALVRNQETRERCVIEDSEYTEYRRLYESYMVRAGNGEFSVAEAQLRFTLDMCRRFGYAFYAGRRGHSLRRLFKP